MSGQKARNQIIAAALKLFNIYGFGSVTIRQIADELGVDRRNIIYHFDKDGLLKAISNEMWEEQAAYRGLKKDFPSFQNLDKEVILYNELQRKYAFIFKDLYVIQHPIIHNRFREFCATMVSDSEQAVAFAIQQGNMNPEMISGTYHALCETVLAISISWLQLQSLRNVENLDQIRRMIWAQIVPHFTDKGLDAFQSFFGREFLKNLGPPFNIKVKTVLF